MTKSCVLDCHYSCFDRGWFIKMYSNSTLVVVPARGNSKRVQNKNSLVIHGQPMIYWPLMAISENFNPDGIIISTDSENIRLLSEKKGLDVPFKRPDYLSDDHTGTFEVVAHALSWFERNIRPVDFVLTIYPTAILLNFDDIEAAMTLLVTDERADGVMPIVTYPHPIHRALFSNSDEFLEMLQPANFEKRTQDFSPAYHDAGQFYLFKSEIVRDGYSLAKANIKGLLLDRDKVVDIDTPEDLKIAQEKLRKKFDDTVNYDWNFKNKAWVKNF